VETLTSAQLVKTRPALAKNVRRANAPSANANKKSRPRGAVLFFLNLVDPTLVPGIAPKYSPGCHQASFGKSVVFNGLIAIL